MDLKQAALGLRCPVAGGGNVSARGTPARIERPGMNASYREVQDDVAVTMAKMATAEVLWLAENCSPE